MSDPDTSMSTDSAAGSTAPLEPALAGKYASLNQLMRDYGRVIVAFSGGIDSSLVAFVAARQLGADALAVTSGSASLKRSDLALAESLANRWGMRHRIIVTDELSNENYRENPVNRCFYCKTSLYRSLEKVAAELRNEATGPVEILNGTNLDDLGDHRPGLVAASDHNVKQPLVEAGFRKADIRALAEHLGLENARKPQAACLSSRFPYGTHIDEGKLAQVEAAEAALEALGFTQLRVRHHGDVARLELLPDDLLRAVEQRSAIEAAVKAAGYRFVAVDLGGFRSGSLNEGIQIVNLT